MINDERSLRNVVKGEEAIFQKHHVNNESELLCKLVIERAEQKVGGAVRS